MTSTQVLFLSPLLGDAPAAQEQFHRWVQGEFAQHFAGRSTIIYYTSECKSIIDYLEQHAHVSQVGLMFQEVSDGEALSPGGSFGILITTTKKANPNANVLTTLVPINEANKNTPTVYQALATTISKLYNIAPPRFSDSSYREVKSHKTRAAYKLISLLLVSAIIFVSTYIIVKHYNRNEIRSSKHFVHNIPPLSDTLKRPLYMERMKHCLDAGLHATDKNPYVMLKGRAGVGKTTIARDYAHSGTQPIKWEFNAESEWALLNCYMELAESLCETREDCGKLRDVKHTEYSYLKLEKLRAFLAPWLLNNKWCFIFNNVQADYSRIRPYLPLNTAGWGQGVVILISDKQNVLLSEKRQLLIPELSVQEAQRMFKTILKTPLGEAETEKLLKLLPRTPMDIALAANYLKACKIPPSDYVKQLSELCSSCKLLKKKKPTDNVVKYVASRRDLMQTTFQQIEKTDPMFRLLLQVQCAMAPQELPVRLLDQLADKATVDAYVHQLTIHSLLCKPPQKAPLTLSLHPSAHSLGRAYLHEHIPLEHQAGFLRQFMWGLNHYFETCKNDKNAMSVLLPHLNTLARYIRGRFSSMPTTLELLELDLNLLRSDIDHLCFNNYQEAIQLTQKALALNKKYHKWSPAKQANIMVRLARIYGFLGDFNQSIYHFQKAGRFADKTGNLVEATRCKLAVGGKYIWHKPFHEAYAKLNGALKQAQQLPDTFRKAPVLLDCYLYMAVLWSITHLHKTTAEKAISYIEKALAIPNLPHDLKARAYKFATSVYCHSGNYSKAKVSLSNVRKHYALAQKEPPIHMELVLQTSKAEILLRTGRLKPALNVLENVVQTYKNIYGDKIEFMGQPPMVLFAEALVRNGEYHRAKRYADKIMVMDKTLSINLHRITAIQAHFHAAIVAAYTQGWNAAIATFKTLIQETRGFVESFADDSAIKLKKLNHKQDSLTDEEVIKTAKMLMQLIYGPDHPFYKRYVRPQLNKLLNDPSLKG